LDKETEELFLKYQAQNESYMKETEEILSKSLNYGASYDLSGDISKLNEDLQQQHL